MFLLDTNLVSEVTYARRNAGVEWWLPSTDPGLMSISAITLAELRYGIDRLQPGRRRDQLSTWYSEEIPRQFRGRVLDVTFDVADRAGALKVQARSSGVTTDDFDCLIAASAVVHDLVVVTRNVRHFQPLGVQVLNPWDAEPRDGR